MLPAGVGPVYVKSGGACALRLLQYLPLRIRVELLHRPRRFGGGVAEVLLVHDAAGADEKGHDAAGAVLDRVGEDCKAPGHAPIDEVVASAARCVRALCLEDAEIVAVEGLTLAL